MSTATVAVTGLHKHYGKTHALRGLELTVPAGTVCGLLGPNGAGKTTAVRVLATLAAPSAGQAQLEDAPAISAASVGANAND